MEPTIETIQRNGTEVSFDGRGKDQRQLNNLKMLQSHDGTRFVSQCHMTLLRSIGAKEDKSDCAIGVVGETLAAAVDDTTFKEEEEEEKKIK
ncbi:hypothetical protein OUZ56_027942 [Daphnia magna]|uniref:Uncharacterized protein n=1 Tax=Daphnia magna TaxID=35525 RepID=A0ABR0B2F0_9CRUS|nr:hypothetical protein OUZ56_027942 [Daphnia magna]